MNIFDKIQDRNGTNSLKWDTIKETYKEENLLPLWVADMDFMVAPTILSGLSQIIEHGILGYCSPSKPLIDSIRNWQKTHYDLTLSEDAILFSSGVVPSIILCIQSLTEVGEAVMIHNPVYPPFASSILNNNRTLVQSPLIEDKGKFKMNYEDMEQKFKEHGVKLFVLCNPHNPGGRVWEKKELQKLGDLCKKYSVIVISDEIHQDLVFAPYTFITYFNSGSDFKDFGITLTSATKTFNLAGIKNSMIFVENPSIRKKIQKQIEMNGQGEINTFGLLGTQLAYETGEEWRKELLAYVQENYAIVKQFFNEKLPQISVMELEGTYLVWLNFSAFNLSDADLQKRLVHRGKVLLNAGISFGSEGTQHMRLNLACQKETLKEGLSRIYKAFEDIL